MHAYYQDTACLAHYTTATCFSTQRAIPREYDW